MEPSKFLKGIIIIKAAGFALAILAFVIFNIVKKPDNTIPVLEIQNSISGKIYARYVLKDNEFSIEFIHSVNQSPVRDTFEVQGTDIRLVASRFYSYGAGMPSDLEEEQTISRDDDAIVITGFDRVFTELNYIVGTVSDHQLFINGKTVNLTKLCGKNAQIKIFIN